MYTKFSIENSFLLLLGLLPLSIILGSSVSLSFILIISLLFIYYSFKNKDWKWMDDKHIKILIILFVYLIVNSIFSVESSLGISRNLGFVRYIILVAAVKHFLTKQKNYDFIFIFWTTIIIITCFDVFFEFIFGRNVLGYGELYGGRIVSFFKDEPVVGGYLLPFFFLIAGFLFYKIKNANIFIKLLSFAIPTIIFFSIFLSGERANSFKALIGMIIFILFLKFGNLKKKMIATLLIISILLITIFNSAFLKHRFYYQFTGEGTKISLNYLLKEYTVHYKNGIKIFKDYPLFGVGNKNFGYVCFRDYPPEKTGIGCINHPHQIYLELLSEHGIIGTAVILLIFFYFFVINLKSYLRNKNEIHLGSIIYFFLTFLPLIPSGSFFGSFNSTLFWLNFSFMLSFRGKKMLDNTRFNEKI